MRGFICVLGFMLVMVAWPAQAVVLFEDQFDSSLDTSKWDQVRSTGSGSGYVYGTGSTVTESGGVLTVSQAATDNGGGVVTKPIDIADEGVVTVTMRSYVRYHNTNFSGQSILLGDDGHFLNRIFHSRYNSLNAFYLDYPSSSYPSVPPTWNNWIIGTLTHDPASGESTYKYLFDGTETELISHTN
ncbi:MAG: hypothetical protein H6926_03415 [Chromatiales bacterium]|nr:hypothetical protein [Chromatiales bacterium]